MNDAHKANAHIVLTGVRGTLPAAADHAAQQDWTCCAAGQADCSVSVVLACNLQHNGHKAALDWCARRQCTRSLLLVFVLSHKWQAQLTSTLYTHSQQTQVCAVQRQAPAASEALLPQPGRVVQEPLCTHRAGEEGCLLAH